MMTFVRIYALMAAWMLLLWPQVAGAVENLLPAEVLAEVGAKNYLIGPGDMLGIEVWKEPSLTRTVVVLPDGKITFPLIGEVVAGGKTVSALKKEVEDQLIRFVPELVLTLEVRQPSLFVYVLGRVNIPGRSQLSSNVNVLQALATAGGLNPFAKREQISIFRFKNGNTTVIPFNYDAVTAGQGLEGNIELMRGDVIFVP
jgi:polysaccharide export outer membrane protein